MLPPTAFDPEAFLKLAPDWRGQTFYFPTIPSTNGTARLRLHEGGGPQEFLLVTDKQTAGRGRLNRAWQAPFATGLLCSLSLPLAPLELDQAYLYTASLALAVKKAVGQQTGQTLALKWPNDLVREGRKCGGILAELEQVSGVTWLVLGFGLNTGLTERDLAEAGLTGRATNLIELDDAPWLGREELLAGILAAFTAYRDELTTDPTSVHQEWADALVTLGQSVRVLGLDGKVGLSGQAVGVEPTGGLLVRDETGNVHTVQAGDVSVRLSDGGYA